MFLNAVAMRPLLIPQAYLEIRGMGAKAGGYSLGIA